MHGSGWGWEVGKVTETETVLKASNFRPNAALPPGQP